MKTSGLRQPNFRVVDLVKFCALMRIFNKIHYLQNAVLAVPNH